MELDRKEDTTKTFLVTLLFQLVDGMALILRRFSLASRRAIDICLVRFEAYTEPLLDGINCLVVVLSIYGCTLILFVLE